MLTSKDMEGRSFNLTETSPLLLIKSEESQKNPLDSPRADQNSNTEFTECRSRVYFENCALLACYATSCGISLPRFRYNLSVPSFSKSAASTCSVSYCYYTVHRPTRVQKSVYLFEDKEHYLFTPVF